MSGRFDRVLIEGSHLICLEKQRCSIARLSMFGFAITADGMIGVQSTGETAVATGASGTIGQLSEHGR
jgi:hypothetical protein